MKKIFLSLLLMGLAFAVFAQTSTNGVGTIRELSGEVELKHAGSASFTPARAGSTVSKNTIISTGFKSTAVIVIGSNTITVRPLTRLSLAEIISASDTETVNVNLQTGRVRVEVKPPAGTRASTQVKSPSATASVRGTTFEMDTASLYCAEGKVMFMGSDGVNVAVTGGSSSSVTADGASIEPAILAEADLMPPAPVGLGESGEDISIQAALTDNVQLDLTWN